MKIVSALYASKPVTEIVQNLVKDGTLNFKVGNYLFGDPKPGFIKSFEVVIRDDEGKITTIKKRENEFLVYPLSSVSKLGIWYSNCPAGVETSTLASLKSIQKAADSSIDIVTCVWKPIEGNPFRQIPAWTQSYGHLNQVIQILQCLYTARVAGRYDYVCFLEHDVLYPENYFSFPELDPGTLLVNTNYIGVKREGYQSKKQNDHPLHQMTLRYDEALAHFEKLTKTAIHVNSGILEPPPGEIKRIEWQCANPAVHINHGKHFTSHYSIYGKPGEKVHEYWGDCEKYF